MNLLEARAEGGALSLENRSFLPFDGSFEGEVVVGIRPEHLHQADGGPLAMSVSLAESPGANTQLHGSLEGCSKALTAGLPGIHRPSRSEHSVYLAVDAEIIHLFDKANGQRIASKQAGSKGGGLNS